MTRVKMLRKPEVADSAHSSDKVQAWPEPRKRPTAQDFGQLAKVPAPRQLQAKAIVKVASPRQLQAKVPTPRQLQAKAIHLTTHIDLARPSQAAHVTHEPRAQGLPHKSPNVQIDHTPAPQSKHDHKDQCKVSVHVEVTTNDAQPLLRASA